MLKYNIIPKDTWLKSTFETKQQEEQSHFRHGYIDLELEALPTVESGLVLNPFEMLKRKDHVAFLARLLAAINNNWAKFAAVHVDHKNIQQSLAAGYILRLKIEAGLNDSWMVTLQKHIARGPAADVAEEHVTIRLRATDLPVDGFNPTAIFTSSEAAHWNSLADLFSDDSIIALCELRPASIELSAPAAQRKNLQKLSFDATWNKYSRERALAMDARLNMSAAAPLYIQHMPKPPAQERLTAFFSEISNCEYLSFMEKRLSITAILTWLRNINPNNEVLQLSQYLEAQQVLVQDFRCQMVGMSEARKNSLQLRLADCIRKAPQPGVVPGSQYNSQLNHYTNILYAQDILQALLHVNLDEAAVMQLIGLFVGVYCYNNAGDEIIAALKDFAAALLEVCKTTQRGLHEIRCQEYLVQDLSKYMLALPKQLYTNTANADVFAWGYGRIYYAAQWLNSVAASVDKNLPLWFLLLTAEWPRVSEQSTQQNIIEAGQATGLKYALLQGESLIFHSCEQLQVDNKDLYMLKFSLVHQDDVCELFGNVRAKAMQLILSQEMCVLHLEVLRGSQRQMLISVSNLGPEKINQLLSTRLANINEDNLKQYLPQFNRKDLFVASMPQHYQSAATSLWRIYQEPRLTTAEKIALFKEVFKAQTIPAEWSSLNKAPPHIFKLEIAADKLAQHMRKYTPVLFTSCATAFANNLPALYLCLCALAQDEALLVTTSSELRLQQLQAARSAINFALRDAEKQLETYCHQQQFKSHIADKYSTNKK